MDVNDEFRDKIEDDYFWQSINILIKKPHVVNKRLWGGLIINNVYIKETGISWEKKLKHCKLKSENKNQYLVDIQEQLQIEITENETDYEILIVELLPKNYTESHAFQCIYKNKHKALVTFCDVTPVEFGQSICPTFSYTFSLQDNKVILNFDSDDTNKSYQWLKLNVLPQVIKWCDEILNKQTQICNESLVLVSNEKYYIKYNNLKLKYGLEMVKIWPECTDPTKFVYEDIAIATYLLLLWEHDAHPQSFVDVGCGNGLLVYILTMEGHIGYGVDVRKRKIWELYPNNVKLKEITVTPFNMHIFSGVDWLIGNHSDELTPWIPVIAQKSYKSNFFLLPCCAYNFDGSKYQRKNSSKSQYTEYLEYIKQLSESCGFNIKMDRLKIPSTKRICLIGKMRTYIENDHDKFINNIKNMINAQVGLYDKTEVDKDNEIKEIKTRNPIEKVKNCTQIDKNVTEYIISFISKYLLDGCDLKTTWSKGKNVAIHEIVNILPHDKLKTLKSECGGIQTLLRNNHHIFEVRRGHVNLRYPRTVDEVKSNTKNKKNMNNLRIQVKKCWFHENHPQGCPLDSSKCSFLHDKAT